jgi:GTP1/Obg family GTP-binding protein
MNSQPLQQRLKEIQSHIDDFKKTLSDSQSHYQMSLELIADPVLRSSLMEQHVVETERQRAAIDRMEALYDQVRDHLASLGQSNS